MDIQNLKQKIEQTTQQLGSEALSFLADLVNINSFTGNAAGLKQTAELILAKGLEFGLGFERRSLCNNPEGPFHLVYTSPSHDPSFYGLIGHFDTVHSPKSPFQSLSEADGRLYGPGIQDMKSGLVAAFFSCVALNQLLGPERVPVRLILNCDEETGSQDSRSLIESELAQAAGAFIFEGHYATTPALITSRKGIVMGSITTRGQSAHAGEAPQDGANAIVEMAHKVTRLDRLNDYQAGRTATTGTIRGGIAGNQVPACCEMELDLRFKAPEDEQRLRQEVENILQQQFIPGTKTEFELKRARPCFKRTRASESLRDHYLEAAAIFGRKLGEASVGGGSDGNLTAAMGIPTLDGLGCAGDGPHTDQEYILKGSLLESMQHFTLFLYQRLNQTRRTA